jgi:hypothetical protein
METLLAICAANMGLGAMIAVISAFKGWFNAILFGVLLIVGGFFTGVVVILLAA